MAFIKQRVSRCTLEAVGYVRTKKYVPDIVHLGALFESNYRRIMKLLHLVGEGDELNIDLYNGANFIGKVNARNIDTSKYTDTIVLEQISAAGKWLNNPVLTVRMYHDVAVAEVINSRGHRALAGVNDYPNKFMHHPDEKVQLNRFLAEWLSFCLRYGISGTHPFDSRDL